MKLLLVSACSSDKKYNADRGAAVLDTTSREDLLDADPEQVAPAAEMYTGVEHQRVSKAYTALQELGTVNWQIISAGFGLLEHNTDIVPYECTLSKTANDKEDYQKRAERLGIDTTDLTIDDLIREIGRAKSIPADLARLDLGSYDAIFITLGYEYLLTIQYVLRIIPTKTPAIVFVSDNACDLVGPCTAIPAGEDERKKLGVAMTRLKGTQLQNLAHSIQSPDELRTIVNDPNEIYEQALRGPQVSVSSEEPETKNSHASEDADDSDGKYAPLAHHLRQQQSNQVELSFEELESVIGDELPNSAYTYGAWWGNDESSAQSKTWLEAGWEVAAHDRDEEWVWFEPIQGDDDSVNEDHEEREYTENERRSRKSDLDQFYDLLADLESRVGGMQKLKDCTGYMDWPDRGIYFFFDSDERREETDQLRLTRVGTHAIYEGSSTSLWDRLRTHRGAKRGTYEGGGNHRGSVFRERIGEAMIEQHGIQNDFPEWGIGSSAGREVRLDELPHERQVSDYIRNLPFLWVSVDDKPGSGSDRKTIERNAIALVSNFEKEPIDSRSDEWLGHCSPRRKIRESGLWNIDHVEENYDPEFLDKLQRSIERTTPP